MSEQQNSTDDSTGVSNDITHGVIDFIDNHVAPGLLYFDLPLGRLFIRLEFGEPLGCGPPVFADELASSNSEVSEDRY